MVEQTVIISLTVCSLAVQMLTIAVYIMLNQNIKMSGTERKRKASRDRHI